MDSHKLIPALNNTKWEEIRLAMHELGVDSPKWRTRDVESGYVSEWSREWYYHFRQGGYVTIECCEIHIESPDQGFAVLDALQQIKVPGKRTEDGFIIYGHIKEGQGVEYLM